MDVCFLQRSQIGASGLTRAHRASQRISTSLNCDCCNEELENSRFRLLWKRCRQTRIWAPAVLAIISAARLSFPAQLAHVARQAGRGVALPAIHAAVLCGVVMLCIAAATRASGALPASRREQMRWNLLTLGQWVGFGAHQAIMAAACGWYRSLPLVTDFGLCDDVLRGNFAVVLALCPLVFTVVASEYLCLSPGVTAAAGTLHLTVNAVTTLAVAGSSLRWPSLWGFAFAALGFAAMVFVSASHLSLLRDVMDAGRKVTSASAGPHAPQLTPPRPLHV